jgi:hypothetical protein
MLNRPGSIRYEIEMPHVHVLLQGMGKGQISGHALPVIFNTHDFAYLCERGRAYSLYEQQRFLTEQLRILDHTDQVLI